MQMVGCRRAALRSVVNDEVAGKSRRQSENTLESPLDALWAMLTMRNRQMSLEDRKRIAVDKEVVTEW